MVGKEIRDEINNMSVEKHEVIVEKSRFRKPVVWIIGIGFVLVAGYGVLRLKF